MAGSARPSPAEACAEAIALLHLLHDVPARPSSNPLPPTQTTFTDNGLHAWPLAEELSLTQALSFLSSVADDPNHVVAVCVCGSAAEARLNVLVAVNQASHGDGASYLRTIVKGFETIFQKLSRVQQVSNMNPEDDVFSAIVSMCSARIRSRMRLVKHKRNKARQTIKTLLEQAIDKLGAGFADFRRAAQAVIQSLNKWTQHQTKQRLCAVIDAVLGLSRASDVPQVLGTISNRSMNPTERAALLKMVRSVSRYRETANFLCRLAEKHAIARKMSATSISIPVSAFPQPSQDYSPDLHSVFSRLKLTGSQYHWNHISHLLGLRRGVIGDEFKKQCKKTLTQGKVHAEMQLIYHCQTTLSRPPPRVIASSKKACFLCNAFISQMTKFHTPKSHGRLYPGWKVPVFPPSCDIERRFAQRLDNLVKTSIKTLLSTQKRTCYPQPSESSLWTMKSWTSTASVAADADYKQLDATISSDSDTAGPPTEDAAAAIKPPSTACDEEESDTPQPESRTKTAPASSTSDIKTGAQQAEASTCGLDTVPSSREPCIETSTLPRGTPVSTTVMAGESSRFFETRPLKLQIEYEVGPNSNHQADEKAICCTLEWLSEGDADLIRANEAITVVSAETLDAQTELPVSVKTRNSVYISAGETILKVDLPAID